MRKLRLIATGGTIACIPTARGLTPELAADDLLDFVDIDKTNIECMDLFSMDSSNIQPEEWRILAEAVYASSQEYDGIIITHGTDTMAYTASMLSFMLRGIGIPVIFTGAQYPIVYPDSDGRKNLENAVITAREIAGGGVYVCFGGSIMLGCRAVKTHTTSLNAFESINYPYIGTVVNGQFIQLHSVHTDGKFSFSRDIDPSVTLVKLVPGTSANLLGMISECGIRGVVVEAFGLGGVHNFRRDHTEILVKFMEQGIIVMLASQCLYEPSTPDIYEVSRPLKDAGIIPSYDMTTEAAVTKLMWALGQTSALEEIRRIMYTNICGEIDFGAGIKKDG